MTGSKADIILRSIDRVKFKAHKSILSPASPIFKDMFDVGDEKVSTPEGTPPDEDHLPIVDFTETHRVLHQIIYHCYPVEGERVKIRNLSELAAVFEAAAKYDMQNTILTLGDSLEQFKKSHPLQVFALSCRYGLEHLAQASAQNWRTSLPSRFIESSKVPHGLWKHITIASCFVPEMDGMHAGAFYRLVQYLRTGDQVKFSKSTILNGASRGSNLTFQMTQYPDADIEVQSYHSQTTFFQVHKVVLSTSSPALMQLIDDMPSSEGLPTLRLHEYDHILQIILASCYPSMLTDMPSPALADLPEIVSAAKKYRLTNLIEICRQSIAAQTITDPLKAYLVAAECGWKAEARNAAVRLAQRALESQYSSYLEITDTAVYFPLLKFCHEYRQVIFKLTGGCKGRSPKEMWAEAEWCCDGMTGDASNLAWAIAMYLMESGYNRKWSELKTLREKLLTQLEQVGSLSDADTSSIGADFNRLGSA